MKQKLYIGIVGFDKDFTEYELSQLLMKHAPTLRPRIRNGNAYEDSRVLLGMEYQVRSLLSNEG